MLRKAWSERAGKSVRLVNNKYFSLTKLIKSLEQIDSLEQFIQFSTPEVYGSTDTGWIKGKFNPSTPYAVSRASGDMMLKIYIVKRFSGKVYSCGKCLWVGQPLYRIIPRTYFSMLTPNKLQLHGGGKSVRSFIHIQDVNTALIKIINEKLERTIIFQLMN